MNNSLVVIIVLFFLSAFFAWRSLKNLNREKVVKTVKNLNPKGRVWGIILFLGDKVIHYSNKTSEAKVEDSVDNKT